MKKLLIIIASVTLIFGFGSVSFAGIDNSSHDLGDDSLGTTEICVFCHVPHNPQDTTDAPLWNRGDSAGSFTTYDGTTGVTATGISNLCLSCHDGVTNLDAFGGTTGTAGNDIATKFSGTTANVGEDLQDDHPVMVTMPDGTGDFNTRASVSVARLFNNNVECASCHNPHDDSNVPFLVASNAASAICLDCHNK